MALRWGARLLLVIALVVITDLALQPGSAVPTRLLGSDKVEHFAAFFVLAVLLRLSWPGLPAWLGFITLVGYGAGIEWLQATGDAGRTASAADLVADAVGALCGLVAARVSARRMRD